MREVFFRTASALRNAARPAVAACFPTLSAGRAPSAVLRMPAVRPNVFGAASCGISPQRRMMSSGKGGKEPEDTLESNLTEMREFLRDEIIAEEENHIDPTSVSDGPPSGFKLVPTGKYLAGNDDVVIMLERTYNNERICVVTSTEVVDTPEDDMDEMLEEDEEEDETNGYDENGGLNAMLLIAITKPDQKQPLYFECFFDRFGVQIIRSHVGLGYSGFMSEQGTAATLYHTYIGYRTEISAGPEADSLGEYQEEEQAASSPNFEELDDKLQKHFNNMLTERGVNTELCEYLMDVIFTKEHLQYQKFLQRLEQWVA